MGGSQYLSAYHLVSNATFVNLTRGEKRRSIEPRELQRMQTGVVSVINLVSFLIRWNFAYFALPFTARRLALVAAVVQTERELGS